MRVCNVHLGAAWFIGEKLLYLSNVHTFREICHSKTNQNVKCTNQSKSANGTCFASFAPNHLHTRPGIAAVCRKVSLREQGREGAVRMSIKALKNRLAASGSMIILFIISTMLLQHAGAASSSTGDSVCVDEVAVCAGDEECLGCFPAASGDASDEYTECVGSYEYDGSDVCVAFAAIPCCLDSVSPIAAWETTLFSWKCMHASILNSLHNMTRSIVQPRHAVMVPLYVRRVLVSEVLLRAPCSRTFWVSLFSLQPPPLLRCFCEMVDVVLRRTALRSALLA